MSKSENKKVITLTSSNWLIWEMTLKTMMKSKKIYKEALEDDEPVNKTTNAWKEWKDKNDQAMELIVLNLSPEQLGQFLGKEKAKEVWNELKSIHVGKIEDRKIDVQVEMKGVSIGVKESVTEYITRGRGIMAKASTLGITISEREAVFHLVRGLGSKFEKIAGVLRAQRSLTLQELQNILHEEEKRLNENKESETAFRARHTQRKPPIECYVCKKKGHYARDCWHNKENQEKKNENNDRGKYSSCYNNNKGKSNRKEKAKMAIADEYALWSTQMKEYGDNDGDIDDFKWYYDSGCSKHMTPKKNWIDNYVDYVTDIYLAEENRSIKSEGKGDIRVQTRLKNGEIRNLCFKDVLYAPKLRNNLMSIKNLVNLGNTVTFDNEQATVRNKDGVVVAEGQADDQMFVLSTFKNENNADPIINEDKSKYETENEQNLTETCFETKESATQENKNDGNEEFQIWHRRLGHLNPLYIKKMAKNELVRGLKIKSADINKMENLCDACCLGKMTDAPHRRIENHRAKQPLDIICMDLVTMPVESIGGSKYLLTIIDVYTRRIFTYFLKNKSETYAKFLDFKARREKETGLKLKIVRTDNGGEFVNKDFEDTFTKEGIKHERTCFYNSASNGIVERANRTVTEIARCMMQDAKLPPKFWAEATSTAAYIHNCTPTNKGEGPTPMELWTGNKPNVKHLRVFGCKVYYYIPKQKRNKLEPRAKKGMFVGYSKNQKAYRIYDLEERKFINQRTVKFFENERQPYDENENENENEINQENQNGNQVEENQNQPNENALNEEQFQIVKKKGRKKGDTKEKILERRRVETQADEARLKGLGVRRSDRNRNKTITYNQDHVAMLSALNVSEDDDEDPLYVPKNYKEAIRSKYANEWIRAMEEEIMSLTKVHGVWKLKLKPKDKKIIRSKWVFAIKLNPDGSVKRRKARLVAMGHNQEKGQDYEESFAPVIKLESIRLLLSIAANRNYKIKTFDVKTAYLYGELSEDVYMQQPEGFEVKNEDGTVYVCNLQKSLYGLPQSGLCWNRKLNEILRKIGMRRMESEPCIYEYKENSKTTIVGTYVDDLIVTGDEETMEKIISKLREHLILTEQESQTESQFLGLKIKQTQETIEINQESYIERTLEKFGMKDCNPAKTPRDTNQDLNNCEDSKNADIDLYQSMIGSLTYLAIATRPDIAYSVSELAQFNHQPKELHLTAIKRIFRYLKGTKTWKLMYQKTREKIEVSTDASWNRTADGKGFSGYITNMGKNIISWKCKKQVFVALSSCESEIMALKEGVKELKWLRNIMAELDLHEQIRIPISVKTDSKSAIEWVQNRKTNQRTKHINRIYYFVREEAEKGNIKIEYQPTEEITADVLTKPLSREKLHHCLKDFLI